MAIQYTGLGWYADSDWLSNQQGVIGSIERPPAGAALVPQVTYQWPITSDWLYFCWNTRADKGMYCATLGSSPIYIIYVRRVDRWLIASTDRNAVFGYQTDSSSDNWTTLSVNAGEYNSPGGTRLYYRDSLYANVSGPTNPDIPMYQDMWVGLAAIAEIIEGATGASSSFSKNTAGYSVTCMCEWRAEVDGDVYCSPVLISSVENNTLYTRNSSATSVPATEHTYQGMTFYMRKAPLDVITGSDAVVTDFPIVYLTGSAQTSDTIFAAIALASSLGAGYPPQPPDPYGPGGTSEPGISEGTFDETSDIIVDSNVPTYSFSGTGFSRIYNPDLTQLGRLANYLWTDTTFLQTIINHGKQLLENPMEAIISLSLLPCTIPHSTTAEEVKVMYVGTGVSMYPATTQFVDVDCGSLLIDKFYDSALDFNPYTTVSLFLPFIGMVDLDADEVMGRYLQVKYRVDIISGACVAKVFVSDADAISYSCRYQFNGDCAVSMPLNSADFSGYRAAFIAAATAVTMGTMAAAGGAGGIIDAVMAGGVETSSAPGTTEVVSTALTAIPRGGALQERVAPAFTEPTKNAEPHVSLDKIADVVSGSAANLVSTVMNGKMHFQHASGFGGNAGMLGIRRPFVVIKRPRMCNPEEYGVYNGRPCQMYLSLSTISGFTQVGNIHLTGIPATIPELNEIAGFLKSGVIL